MGTFKTSSGDRVKKSVIDRRVREAKRQVLDSQLAEFGFNFCVVCEVNSSNAIIDCAHVMSVDECQKRGMAEVAWDLDNINPTCRECHREQDKSNLKFSKDEMD